jgi:hypothetical protein
MVQQAETLTEPESSITGKQYHHRLLLAGIVLFLSYVYLAVLQDWDANIPLFLTVYFFCFTVYGFCLFWLFQGRLDRISPAWIIVPALLFRLLMIGCDPTLSEDFYRYRWDGLVQISGHSPYEFPPEASELESLRDVYYERINHKEFRTPYSVAAETFYRLFAMASMQPWVFKSFILLFDLLLLEVIRRLLLRENRNPAWLILYGWHPLPIIEFAGSGHMDIIGISCLFLAHLLVQNRRTAVGGVAFAAAVLTKYLPVLAFPWFLKRGKWKFVLAAIITAALLLLQYYTPDLNMFSGVLSYYKKWRFNDSLFGILYDWLGGAEPARIAGMLFTLAAIGLCLWKRFSFYRASFIVFGSVMLFSPVVHPWYLCWILPFLVFHQNRPWIFLCGWIALAYLVRHLFPVGVWKPLLWLKLLIYIPFYLWLLIDTFWRTRDKNRITIR